MAYKKDWAEYYKVTKAKPPRPLLISALKYVVDGKKALDIGGGALRDTKYLLDQGFDVTVIDKSPLMKKEADEMKNERLNAHTVSYEDFDFPVAEYDIAVAMYSLPFCEPAHFDTVIKRIKDSLKIGGVFCGQLFGDRDEWSSNAKMTFHTIDQAKKVLEGLEIVFFQEEEKNDKTSLGEMKHWHVFHFIAVKR